MRDLIRNNKAIVFIFLLTITALLYVNQQALIYQMGLRVKENRRIYSKLVDRNKILVYNVLNLKSPLTLETKLLAEERELDMPHTWQVVRLESSPDKDFRENIAKKGLFASLFIVGREAEASPNKKYIDTE